MAPIENASDSEFARSSRMVTLVLAVTCMRKYVL